MERSLLITLLLGIMMFTLVSAEVPHLVDTDLYFSITSNNATQCNTSTIAIGTESPTLLNTPLNKSSQTFYGVIDKSYLTTLGTLTINVVCTDGVGYATGSLTREITYNGTIITLTQSIIYVVLMIITILFAIMIIWFIKKIPSGNNRSDEGLVLSINWLKYAKTPLWSLVYLSFMAVLYLAGTLGIVYVNGSIGNFLFTLFLIMAYSGIILVPILFYKIILDFINDSKVKKLLERGIDVE